MFRELMRKKREISRVECIEVLKAETRGVLSVIGDGGYPYGTPMNHYYNEDDGCVYFHCGRQGHRLDSLKKDCKASFCVYDEGYRNEGEWALNVKSVIIFGKMEIIDDIDEVKKIALPLCEKFTQDKDYIKKEIAAHAAATIILKLTPEHICGKLVNES